VVDAIREAEQRRLAIAGELVGLREDGARFADEFETVMPQVRRRLDDWRAILTEETSQARRMLRMLHRRPAGVYAETGGMGSSVSRSRRLR
jgi:hypothetical protein